jgi:intracellular septation protein A
MDEINVNPDDLMFAVFILPPVIAIINQTHWRDEVRALVAMVACLVYAFGITALRQDLDWTMWRDTVIQVLVGTFGAYKLFWKPSHIAPDIEAATTLRREPEVTREDDSLADS